MRIQKTLHKILAWVVVVAMVMSTGITARADESVDKPETTELTLDEEAAQETETQTQPKEGKRIESETALSEGEEEENESYIEDTEEASEEISNQDTQDETEQEANLVVDEAARAGRAAQQYDLTEAIDAVVIEIWNEDLGAWQAAPDDYVYDANEQIRVTLEYSLLPEWLPVSADDLFYYQIPDEIGWVNADSGYVVEGATWNAGRYSVSADGLIEIKFQEDYLAGNSGNVTKVSVSFEGNLGITQVEGEKTVISFGDIEKEININPESVIDVTGMTIEKRIQESGITINEDGKTVLTYELLVTAPSSNTKDMTDVVVTDALEVAGNYAQYLADSFTCNGEAVPGTLTIDASGSAFTWDVGTMEPNTSYLLTYEVEVDLSQASAGGFSIQNNAAVDAAELEEAESDSHIQDLSGSMHIEKTATKDIENNKIYYTITVTADQANQNSLTDVVVTDAFGEGKDYVIGYDMEDSGIDPDTAEKTFTWEVGDLAPGESKTLTYSVDIDPEIWTAEDPGGNGTVTHNIKNTATSTANGAEASTSETTTKYSKTWIKKSATDPELTEDGTQINYTVYINQNTPIFDLTDLDVVFSDKITSSNALYTGLVQVDRLDGNGVVIDTIYLDVDGLDEFEYGNSSGEDFLTGAYVYRFTYSVKVNDDVDGPFIVSNEAGVGIGVDPTNKVHHTTTATKSGTTKAVVEKVYTGTDGTTNSWKSTIPVTVQENDTFLDYLYGSQSKLHEFNEDSVVITDPDGTVLVRDEDYTLEFEIVNGQRQFLVTFLKKIEGTITNPITIEYTTEVIDEAMEGVTGTWLSNSCKLTVDSQNNATASAGFTYFEKNCIIKDMWDTANVANNYDPEAGTISWSILINKTGTMSGTVYVKEELPDGLEIVEDQIEFYPSSGYNNETTPTYDYDPETSLFTIYDVKSNTSPQWNSGYRIEIKIVTRITDLAILTGGIHSITNKASVVNPDGDVLRSSSKTTEIKTETLTKESLSEKSTIDYTIYVNQNQADLVSGDKVEIVDKMGSGLTLVVDSLKVEAYRDDSWETLENGVDYKLMLENEEGSEFALELPDSTYLRITYTAMVSGKVGTTIEATNVVSFRGYEDGEITNETTFEVQQSNASATSETGILISKRDYEEPTLRLEGAEFEIAPVILDENGAVQRDEAGVPLLGDSLVNTKESSGKFITGANGEIFLGSLQMNVLYCYWEKAAPEGYVLDSAKHYFAIENSSSQLNSTGVSFTSYQTGAVVYVYNKDAFDTQFLKTDQNGKALAGAQMTIYERTSEGEKGEVVTSWISGDSAYVVTGVLEKGGEYILEETTAPHGYLYAEDIVFRINADAVAEIISGGMLADGSIVMVDEAAESKGEIEVTKVTTKEGELFSSTLVFYTALFADEEYTERVSEIKELQMDGGFSTTAVFTDLPAGKYYVAEVDEDGEAVKETELHTIDITDGQVVISEEVQTAKARINNQYSEFPEGYLKSYADLEVTKKVLDEEGNEKEVDDTFYVGLFLEAEYETLISEVKPLEIKGASTTTVKYEGLTVGTYYIAETDENGNPLDNSDTGFAYSIHIDNPQLELKEGNKTYEAAITNTLKAEGADPLITPSPFRLAKTGISSYTKPTIRAGVKTEDESNSLFYLVLLVLAAATATATGAFLYRKRSRSFAVK